MIHAARLSRRALLVAAASASALPARAAPATLRGKATQGGLLFARAEAGARVALDGRALRVAPDGRFAFGFGREHARAAELVVTRRDGTREAMRIEVGKRAFDIQRIDGLPPRMVEPSEEDLARIKADAEAIAKARARDSAEPLWDTEWRWPVVGRISGVFGSQRILNGQPRRPHYGVDVAMPTGTPVVAPADGVVSLAHGDMYFTGGTVILDHGHGVGSLYAHLSAVDVAEGTRLRKGERLGAIGATGRATGPHLHWGMTWYALNVDPALVVPPMPAP
jgi:murein DD-endopeptidase MepM/ murein hydrolase activator NlpD